MTDAEYAVTSLIWAAYGLTVGFGLGAVARLMWASFKQR